ncbi:MAG: hypothetical protein PHU54_09995 [Candidatus Omnitrophica bacterium]|nr:hypothetical protein [Candidatus Omnitrophota bacterium]
MPEIDSTQIAWGILFDEKYEDIPDPNKPENIPYFTARKRERAESLERLINGPGRVLFEQWRGKLKRGLLALLVAPDDPACHCSSCMMLRKMRIIFELWIEAQRVLEDGKAAQ